MVKTKVYWFTKKDLKLLSVCNRIGLKLFPVTYSGGAMYLAVEWKGKEHFLNIPTSNKSLGRDIILQYRVMYKKLYESGKLN